MARENHDEEKLVAPPDVLERERAFAQEEIEDQTEALNSLYAEGDS